MFELTVALIVLACISASYWLGIYATRWTSALQHTAEMTATVRVVIGILITFTALVLSLLTNAAKSTYDETDLNIRSYASELIALDQLLGAYGDETRDLRGVLKVYVIDAIAQTWPDDSAVRKVKWHGPRPPNGVAGLESPAQSEMLFKLEAGIRSLQPRTMAQQYIAQDARTSMRSIMEKRWIVIESDRSSIPTPFFILLVFWLMIIFASFGLSAKSAPVVHVVVALTAISLASVIYLILDLDSTYNGLIAISGAPMDIALAHLGK